SFSYSMPEDEHEITDMEDTFGKYNLTVDKIAVDLNYYQTEANDFDTLITTPDVYNQFAKLAGEETVDIGKDDVVVVGQSSANMMGQAKDWDKHPIQLENGEEVAPDESLQGIAKPNVIPEMGNYYIVGENIAD